MTNRHREGISPSTAQDREDPSASTSTETGFLAYRPRLRDLRMLPIALSAWGGAYIAISLPSVAWIIAVLALVAVFVVLALAVASRSRRYPRTNPGWAGLAVVGLTVVAATALMVAWQEPERSDAASFAAGRTILVEATVVSSVKHGSDGRLWADATTRSITSGDETNSLHVPVRAGFAVTGEQAQGLVPGAQVTFVAEAIAADAGERSALVLFGDDSVKIVPPSGVIQAVAADVRRTFVERASQLPAPGAELLPGLAVGDTRALSSELGDAMIATGLSHLTAVSGSNCALVTAAAFALVALGGGGRRLRVVIALLSLSAFVVLVTFEPSVVRAATMSALAMLTVLVGRPRAGLSMLLLAVTVLLLVDPWLATSAGFALSAAATAALIVLAPALAHGLARFLPVPLAVAIGVPLSAELMCSPIIALFSDQQSLVSVVANLVADPAAPIATVLGLLACLAAPIPILADVLAASAWLPASWIAATATVTAQLPAATLTVPSGLATASVVALIGASIGRIVIGPATHTRSARWSGYAAGIVVTVAVSMGISAALVDGPISALQRPSSWSIAQCDVGQGDAAVVRSGDKIAMIDTGPDIAALSNCLDSLGVAHIDLLVLTHFDLDHVGGVGALHGRVDRVIHGPISDPREQRLLDELLSAGAHIEQGVAGDRGTLGDATWKVVWPRHGDRAFPQGNDASVVIEFQGPDLPRSVFLGDLSAFAQRFLGASGALRGTYPVVKVAHHGSADQDPGLYAALGARAALIGVGRNDYGHPRGETLRMLESTNALIYRSDLSGLLLISRTGDGIEVWQERATDPQGSAFDQGRATGSIVVDDVE